MTMFCKLFALSLAAFVRPVVAFQPLGYPSNRQGLDGPSALFFMFPGIQKGKDSDVNERGEDSIRNNNKQLTIQNPFKEVGDMFANMDEVIDDFMGKRMGQGEIFYGKRKYKPSGRQNTSGRYEGMGHSDFTRIKVARAKKEAFLERMSKRGIRVE